MIKFSCVSSQIGIFRKVAMRMAAISNRKTAAFFSAWRLHVVTQRAHLNLAIQHRRTIVLGRLLTAWAKAAAEMHLVTMEQDEMAVEHVYLSRLAKAWQAMSVAVERGRIRREALLRVLRSQTAAERKVSAVEIILV